MLTHGSYLLVLIELFLFAQTSYSYDGDHLDNLGAFCSNDSSLGDPNLNPIDDGVPKLIRTVQNGSLYTVGTGEDQFWLIHVWGDSGYDYGFAYGTLLKEQIVALSPLAWAHFEQRVMKELDKLKIPKWFKGDCQ
jgi:hypothetical protein